MANGQGNQGGQGTANNETFAFAFASAHLAGKVVERRAGRAKADLDVLEQRVLRAKTEGTHTVQHDSDEQLSMVWLINKRCLANLDGPGIVREAAANAVIVLRKGPIPVKFESALARQCK